MKTAKKLSKKAKKERNDFVRTVFMQALSIEELHGRWFTLQNLVDSINNVFFIKSGLQVSVDEFAQVVIRWEVVQTCIDGKLTEKNTLGFYAYSNYMSQDGNYSTRNIYQITNKDFLPTAIETFDIQTNASIQVPEKGRNHLMGDKANEVHQIKLLNLLELEDKGYLHEQQQQQPTVTAPEIRLENDEMEPEERQPSVPLAMVQSSWWDSVAAKKLLNRKTAEILVKKFFTKSKSLVIQLKGWMGHTR